MLDTNTEIEEELKLTVDVLEDDPHDAGTFVPVVARKISEEATIRKTVQERQTGPAHPEQVVPWPKSGDLRSTSSALKDTSRVPSRRCSPLVRVTMFPHATTPSLLETTLST